MQSFLQRRRLGRFVQAEVEAQKKFLHWDSSTAKLEQRLNEDVAAESTHQEHASLRRVEDVIRSSSATLVAMPEPTPKAKPPFTTNFADHLAERLEGVNPQDLDDKGRPQALLVEGSASDECSPRDWPMSRRLGNTVIIFLIVFVCGWASAANSSSQAPAAKEFHVSQESESLATALFLFGNAFGALLAGPISETAGRNPSYLIFMFLYMVMVAISALARNFAVQIVFRFLSGLFASPPLTIYGGSLADMYNNAERSAVWPIFAISPIAGPMLAPVAGGWIVQNANLSWRWVDWVTLIISFFVFVIAFFCLLETFSPMMLQWKAVTLRKETGDSRFKSAYELQDSLLKRLKTNVTRPVIFFTKEPIVIFFGLYLTLIYVLVFTFLNGFTYIFTDTYGFSDGIQGTAFLAIVVGILLNTTLTPIWRHIYLKRLSIASKSQELAAGEEPTISPEIRLLPAIFCAPLFPISLFWLGWTNYRSISPWSDLIAAGLFGFSLQGIFVASYQYIIDSYETDSASALSSITFLRYVVAGGMVIAAQPMYSGIGVHWTLTIMGVLGVLLVPVPILFWKFGESIRARSSFAVEF